MMFIVDATNIEGSAIQTIAERVNEIIGEVGGTILKLRRMGLRKLTYPINKKTDGFYYLIYFSADTQSLKELNRKLRLVDGILRYLITNPLPTTSLDFEDDGDDEYYDEDVQDIDEDEEEDDDEDDDDYDDYED